MSRNNKKLNHRANPTFHVYFMLPLFVNVILIKSRAIWAELSGIYNPFLYLCRVSDYNTKLLCLLNLAKKPNRNRILIFHLNAFVQMIIRRLFPEWKIFFYNCINCYYIMMNLRTKQKVYNVTVFLQKLWTGHPF